MRYSSDIILDEVKNIHRNKDDFENGDLEERILQYPFYIMEYISLNEIDDEIFNHESDLVLEYSELTTICPPIVVDNSKNLIDGTHRVKAAKKKGLKTILAYIGQDN